jgi:hypothetical protein
MEKLRTEMWTTVGTVGLTVAGRLFAAEECQRAPAADREQTSESDPSVNMGVVMGEGYWD